MISEGNNTFEITGNIATLKVILERSQGEPLSQEEVTEIGESLLSFFELLAVDDWKAENE